MPQYTYKARDGHGRLLTGIVEAETARQAAEKLHDRSVYIVDLRQQSSRFSRDIKIALPCKRAKKRDLAVFARQLATLIKAGVPLLQSLEVLSKQLDNARLRTTVAEVAAVLEEGNTFADALRSHDRTFPDLFINMVEVGETGGVLDEVMEQLAVHYEREHEIQEKVKSALTYPAVILAIAIFAVIFLLVFVLPAVIAMLSNLGAELPLPTRIVMGASALVREYWYIIVILAAAFFVAFKKYTNKGPGRLRWHRVLLRLPVIRKLHLLTVVSRFSRTLGTLLKGGVPVLQALEVVKKTAGNAVAEEGITRAQDNIREGQGMAQPLKECGVFPPMVIQIIQVGEETGTLDDLLIRVSAFYDREIDALVTRLSSIIEPLLIVLLGGVVGFIIISVLLPMFNIYSAAGM